MSELDLIEIRTRLRTFEDLDVINENIEAIEERAARYLLPIEISCRDTGDVLVIERSVGRRIRLFFKGRPLGEHKADVRRGLARHLDQILSALIVEEEATCVPAAPAEGPRGG